MAVDTFDDVDVSLEPQLRDALRPLPLLLPPVLADQLSSHLPSQELDASISSPSSTSASVSSSPSSSASVEARSPTVPYALLLSISKWSRTPAGAAALAAHTPPLVPQAYTMVSLLAGTRTSPNRRFPAVRRKTSDDRMREMARSADDKRAIIAVLNGLLSVGGAGAAAWVAAQRTGWRDEWKVLFAFLAASIVAASEVVLYIIWESRRSGTSASIKRATARPIRHKKSDDSSTAPPDVKLAEDLTLTETSTGTAASNDVSLSDGALRRRAGLASNERDSD